MFTVKDLSNIQKKGVIQQDLIVTFEIDPNTFYFGNINKNLELAGLGIIFQSGHIKATCWTDHTYSLFCIEIHPSYSAIWNSANQVYVMQFQSGKTFLIEDDQKKRREIDEASLRLDLNAKEELEYEKVMSLTLRH